MAEETKNNRRISLLATLIAAVVLMAVIVANAFVWNDYRDKRAEIGRLNGEISQVYQRLGETPEPPKNLEDRLAIARVDLAAAKVALPSEVNRNDVIDYLLNLAEKCQVEIVPLVSEGWSVDNDGTPYRVLRLNGTVTGSLSQATSFISELQDSKYMTLTITGLTVTGQNEPPDGNSSPGSDTPVMVRLSIALYAGSPVLPEDITS